MRSYEFRCHNLLPRHKAMMSFLHCRNIGEEDINNLKPAGGLSHRSAHLTAGPAGHMAKRWRPACDGENTSNCGTTARDGTINLSSSMLQVRLQAHHQLNRRLHIHHNHRDSNRIPSLPHMMYRYSTNYLVL